MKSSIKLFAIAAFVVALTAISATAQRSAQYRAEIPFEFSANGKAMPAGDYIIGLVGPDSGNGILRLRTDDSRHATNLGFVIPESSVDKTTGTLRFIKTGDDYTLAEVAMPGYSRKVKNTKTNLKMLSKAGVKYELVSINIGRM